MLFKFKSKPIYIDFFTNDYALYDLFKIEPTSKHKPNWLSKDLPIRYCPGLSDFLKNSYVIRSWSDIMINVDTHGNVQTNGSNPSLYVTSNSVSHRGNFINQDNYQHLKILSPWVSKASESISCAFYGAAWHNEMFLGTLCNLPAMRNFYYEFNWNIHYMLNKKNVNNTQMIYTNEPLQYFLPLTEKKVNVRCHYDPDEYNKLRSYSPNNFSLSGKSYFRLKKLIKGYSK